MASHKVTILPPVRDKPFFYLPSFGKPREKEFILNCDSQEWKLPSYNSYADNHLSSFFCNPKIRSILVKNGVVDENGNVYRDKTQLGTKKISVRQKLPSIGEDPNIAIKKIILPYINGQSSKINPKLFKNRSAPAKRVNTLDDAELESHKKTLLLRPQPLGSVKKVRALSKDQLAHVFKKFEVKTFKPILSTRKETLRIEERSTDCKDRSDKSLFVMKEEIEDECESANKRLGFEDPVLQELGTMRFSKRDDANQINNGFNEKENGTREIKDENRERREIQIDYIEKDLADLVNFEGLRDD